MTLIENQRKCQCGLTSFSFSVFCCCCYAISWRLREAARSRREQKWFCLEVMNDDKWPPLNWPAHFVAQMLTQSVKHCTAQIPKLKRAHMEQATAIKQRRRHQQIEKKSRKLDENIMDLVYSFVINLSIIFPTNYSNIFRIQLNLLNHMKNKTDREIEWGKWMRG